MREAWAGGGRSRRPTPARDGNWRVWEWVTMATQLCFRKKGAVASERGPTTGATEGPGRDLGRCAKCVANGGGWCCVFVGGDPPGWKFWEGPGGGGGGGEPCLEKEADTKSRRLYFVYLVLGHFCLP